MKNIPIYISLLLLLTCAKEDSQNPNTPPSDITKQYTLTVSAGEGGSVSTPGGTFSSGTQVSITATPGEGYSFSGWSNGSSDNPLSVTLNSNTSVTANFRKITYNTIVEDIISPFLDNNEINFGNNYNLNQYDKALWSNYSYWYNDKEIAPLNEYSMGHSYLTKDFNNDGFTDLFISFFSSEDQFVPFKLFLYNQSSKKFDDFSENIINNIGQPFGRKAMTADLNGDNILDMISVSHPEKEQEEFSYFDILFSTDNTWKQVNIETKSRFSEDIILGGYYHGFAIGDIDNDSDVDIVMGMWHNTRQGITTYLNDGIGNFENFKSILISNTNNIDKESTSFTQELINLDDDECLDLVFWGASNSIIKKGNCDGTFGPDFFELENDLAMDFKGIDLDNDGDNDLVIYRDNYQGDKDFYIYENKSSSEEIIFSSPIIYNTNPDSFNSAYFSFKDVNNDNNLDIIMAGPFIGGDTDLLDGYAYPFADPKSILLSKGGFLFEEIKHPVISPIEKIEFLNNENKLSWMTMFLQNIITSSSEYDENNLRGSVKEWYIYYSDEPFSFSNENNVNKLTIDNSDIEYSQDANNMTTYTLDISSILNNKIYIRIGYKDSYEIESNLSYLISLQSD